MCLWSGGGEGSEEESHQEVRRVCVRGLEGVVAELMLPVEGLLGPLPVPPAPLQLWERLMHLFGLRGV